MSYYHNDFERQKEHERYSTRFLGKPLFWQDILEGLYDSHLFEKKMSDHYAYARELMKGYSGGEWGYLYDYALAVFDYLAKKTEIAELLYPAYKAGDRATLKKIADELLPALREATDKVHKEHKRTWHHTYKAIGWANLDVRYGGVKERCDTAAWMINSYLSGELDSIEALEEDRLNKGLSGFVHYSGIATPNLKT